MKPPTSAKPSFSSSDKTKIGVVGIFLGVLLIVLGFLVGLLLRQSGFQVSMFLPQSQAGPNIPSTSIIPVTSNTQSVLIPPTDCGAPMLVLGTTTFKIE